MGDKDPGTMRTCCMSRVGSAHQSTCKNAPK